MSPSEETNEPLRPFPRETHATTRVFLRLVPLVTVGVALFVGVVVFAFWLLPPWLVPDDGLKPAELLKAENDVRTAALQVIAGLIVAAGLGLTARSVALTARAVGLTREGQVTDRYTRAVEQLGHETSEVARIGGLYALERIADDSERDRETVLAVITAFIREHATPPSAPPRDMGKVQPRPDVAAAVEIIRRWRWPNDGFNLEGAFLAGARLSGARLSNNSVLSRGSLAGARLWRADLSSAFLHNTDLSRARLHEANLKGARLHGANLKGAQLEGADLTGARYSRRTQWPDGYPHEQSGAVEDDKP